MLKRLQINETSVVLEFINDLPYKAAFDSSHGKAVIEIDTLFFKLFPDIVYIGALSHELGHFFLKHLVSKPSMLQEKEADRFCGLLMHQLGFQRPEEVYECLIITPEMGNAIYPPKIERERQINIGWKQGTPDAIGFYEGFNPLVFWANRNDSLIIQINDKMIADSELYLYTYGIFYDTETFSTYQLLNFKNKNDLEGVGRLVSNKTPYCYRRTRDFLQRDKYFLIYQRGEPYEIIDCPPDTNGLYEKNGDLELSCYDKQLKRNVTFILQYYSLAPDNYLLPAYIK